MFIYKHYLFSITVPTRNSLWRDQELAATVEKARVVLFHSGRVFRPKTKWAIESKVHLRKTFTYETNAELPGPPREPVAQTQSINYSQTTVPDTEKGSGQVFQMTKTWPMPAAYSALEPEPPTKWGNSPTNKQQPEEDSLANQNLVLAVIQFLLAKCWA